MNSHDLPYGWSKQYDPVTGFHYFVDHINKVTTWEDPRQISTRVPSSPRVNEHSPMLSRNELLYGPGSNFTSTYPAFNDVRHLSVDRGNTFPRINSPAKKSHNSQSNDFRNSQQYYYSPQSRVSPQPSSSSTQSELQSFNHSNQISSVPSNIEMIDKAQAELDEINIQIEKFSSKQKDKIYLQLEDSLEKLLLRLDNIDCEGNDEIRTKRRKVVLSVQSALQCLDNKLLSANEQPDSICTTNSEITFTLPIIAIDNNNNNHSNKSIQMNVTETNCNQTSNSSFGNQENSITATTTTATTTTTTTIDTNDINNNQINPKYSAKCSNSVDIIITDEDADDNNNYSSSKNQNFETVSNNDTFVCDTKPINISENELNQINSEDSVKCSNSVEIIITDTDNNNISHKDLSDYEPTEPDTIINNTRDDNNNNNDNNSVFDAETVRA